MSEPTAAEAALAERWRVPAAQLAAARDALNHIARLDWPQPDRVHLVARLARGAAADVGTVYAGLALKHAPLASWDQLLPLQGLGDRRVRGLARALAPLDLQSLSVQAGALAAAQQQVQALQAELASLRSELDRVYALVDAGQRPAAAAPMPIAQVAQSVMDQVHQADATLKRAAGALRLGGVALEVHGRATQQEGALALDFAGGDQRSALALRFEGQGSAAAAASVPGEVPSVLGYGPALARRKLAARGLEAVLLASGRGDGRVIRQEPPAGRPPPADGRVRLVLG